MKLRNVCSNVSNTKPCTCSAIFLFKILVNIKFFVQKYLIAALFFGVISFIKPQVLNSEMILQNNIGR